MCLEIQGVAPYCSDTVRENTHLSDRGNYVHGMGPFNHPSQSASSPGSHNETYISFFCHCEGTPN